jgi:Ca2+-binding RTX toxin-like protein
MHTRSLKFSLMALGALAALTTGVKTAEATLLQSPYGFNAAVNVTIGSSNGRQIVLWEKIGTTECTTTVLGTTGLNDNYTIQASSMNDFVWLPAGGWGLGACGGVSGGALNYAGHYLDVDGWQGNDGIGGGAGDTWLLGYTGNDRLETWSPIGHVLGEAGDDTLSARGSGTSQYLQGGDGNDCLQDENAAALVFDCGAGTDSRVSGWTPPGSVSCENVVSFCP